MSTASPSSLTPSTPGLHSLLGSAAASPLPQPPIASNSQPPATPSAAPTPAAAPTPLEQRTWRRTTQRSLRSAVTTFKQSHTSFLAAAESGLTAATQLVNLLLTSAFLPARPLGVLAGRTDVLEAAGGKLLRQQQQALQQLEACVEQAVEAVQAMWASLSTLQQLLSPTHHWQAASPVFHVTTLPEAISLLCEVCLLHSRELAVQQHLLLGFHAELQLSWDAAGAGTQAAAGIRPPAPAAAAPPAAGPGLQAAADIGTPPTAADPPPPPAWQGPLLDPATLTPAQAVQQLECLGWELEGGTPGWGHPSAAAAGEAAAAADRAADAAAAAAVVVADAPSANQTATALSPGAADAAAGSSTAGCESSLTTGSSHSPAANSSGPPTAAASQPWPGEQPAAQQLPPLHWDAKLLAFSGGLQQQKAGRRMAAGEAGEALRGALSVPLTTWKAAACLQAGRVADVLQLLTGDMAGF